MQRTGLLTLSISCILLCSGSTAAAGGETDRGIFARPHAATFSAYRDAEGRHSGAAATEAQESKFTVQLDCATDLLERAGEQRDLYGDEWYQDSCLYEEIEIPDGRPIYALLVSGFHQNRRLDMFHWYRFAQYLQERGAYVHYAWWNNLLAPRMKYPLHDDDSVPSTAPVPWGTLVDARLGADKAIPNDDYQFQEDAAALLKEIYRHNPNATIVLVGHSMGGNAVLRLAERMAADPDPELDGFKIHLLAPIDPVGNRSCIWDPWGNPLTDPLGSQGRYASCNGMFNFTRWRAIREDMLDQTQPDLNVWYPKKRDFQGKVEYLYHRWQQEFGPPFDYSCPGHGEDIWWPCASLYNTEANYLLDHPDLRVHTVEEARQSLSTDDPTRNVQSRVDTDLSSGKDVPVILGNWGGGADGHGELVGFRGAVIGSAEDDFISWFEETILTPFKVFEFESYPLALETRGNWPGWDLGDARDGTKAVSREAALEAWERDPSYLYKRGWEPWNPGLCMVSRDLSNLLDMIIGPPADDGNRPPVAVAGEDQTVAADEDCTGRVTLDGNGSNDPDGDGLAFVWTWNHGTDQATGPNATIGLPPGEHEITLTVNDGQVDSAPDTVTIEVVDRTPPAIELEGSTDVTLECAVDDWDDPGAVAFDNCDGFVAIMIGGDSVDLLAPGTYAITYDAEDSAGNGASQVTRAVVVGDTVPPSFERVAAHPASLWPPNQALVPVHLAVSAYDLCDAALEVILVAVTSNEPDDAPRGGDGHTTGDIQGAEIGTVDYDLLLRAERQGRGDGRIYTITYSATDDSGNGSSSSATVTVGHDRMGEVSPGGKKGRPE